MNRARLLADISYYLTHLRMSVEHLNSLNLQDINVHAETFFRDLLNLALGYQLKNINIVEKNARAIDLPLTVDFIGLSSYGEATESSGVVKITSDLAQPIEDKHVLIVEDIVDTGLTMRYLLDNLATRRPASVKLCTLLHKPSRARTRIPIDYLGFQIEDRFVVGYGLDHGDKYRNVPFIGVLKNG